MNPCIESPRFLADVMLGSLAKWLRILGFDTVYDNRIGDREIIQRCLEERRIALTRDAELTQRRILQQAILIQSSSLDNQLQQVLQECGLGLDRSTLFTRCLQCNNPLEAVEKFAIREEVPPYVFRTQERFKRCPLCGKIFWGGTHRRHIMRRLDRIGLALAGKL